ncbi:MAG: hypothetical protein CSA89_01390 [Bacteroidales bacterium]|nr:MAG: hypothetical protein CSA89_01390 [Bacteroidales bacterium]
MSNKELVLKLSQTIKHTENYASEVLSLYLSVIIVLLEKGDVVDFLSLGKFHTKIKEQDIIEDPKTQKKTLYPPQNIVVFESSEDYNKETIIISKELHTAIADKLALTEEDTEEFVTSLNKVALSFLHRDKTLMIDGFGRFYIDDDRLFFEPEQELNDRLNAELQHLKTVELLEVSNFDLPIETLSRQADEIKDILSDIQDLGTTQKTEPKSKVKPKESVVSEPHTAEVDKKDEVPPTITVVAVNKQSDTENTVNETSADYSPDNVIIRSKKRIWIWIILIFVILFMGGVCYCYLTSYCYKKKRNIEPIAQPNIEKRDDPISQKHILPEVADTNYFENRKYLEYIDTIEVRAGITLVKLSKRYYHSKQFWLYIYEANKSVLPNANNLNIGTILAIPKMEERLINESDSNLIFKLKNITDSIAKQ